MQSFLEYTLPTAHIARYPASHRNASKLMQLCRASGQIEDRSFTELPQLLQPNDCLFLNETKVIPAQMSGQKETGGQVHCQIDRILSSHRAKVFLKANKAAKVGSTLIFASQIKAKVLHKADHRFTIEYNQPIDEVLAEIGQPPLPPYLKRPAEAIDKTRYQTCYAKHPGAVAAPTAGLHFTDEMLDVLRNQGVNIAKLTLHVGAGTFEPLRPEQLASGRLHAEHMHIDEAACQAWETARSQGGRVIAVGTTCVRALESAIQNDRLQPFSGETELLIQPGYHFRAIDAMLTNFHLPGSSLLMLVAAFAGIELAQQAYQHAIQAQYRFFSYGDCMLIQ